MWYGLKYSGTTQFFVHWKLKLLNFLTDSILILTQRCQLLLSLSPLNEALPGEGGSHVARLNFKTSGVGVYKCLLLIVGFAVTVAIWPRKVASCHDFILCAAATFWAMSLVRIYPGSALVRAGLELGASDLQVQHPNRWATLPPVQTHIYNEVVILT